MREVGWVIFDEIHYMRDKGRGAVDILHMYVRLLLVFTKLNGCGLAIVKF